MKTKLSHFKKANLEPYTFPGTDAAVCHIRMKIPEKEVQKLCDLLTNTELRYYPTEEGWDIKIPWWNLGEQSDDSPFEREPKGWDHEHCHFCHEHVSVGEDCYLHENEDKDGYYLFCQKCYAKMKKLTYPHPVGVDNAASAACQASDVRRPKETRSHEDASRQLG